MEILSRINFKKYILMVLASTTILFGFSDHSLAVLLVLVTVSVIVFINQIILLYLVGVMTYKKRKKKKKKILVFLAIFKILILFFALSLGIHFIGDKIILPVLNYVWQIFAIYFSSKQRSFH